MELNLTTKKHPNKGKHTKYSQALIGQTGRDRGGKQVLGDTDEPQGCLEVFYQLQEVKKP